MYTLMPYRPYLSRLANRGTGLLSDSLLRSFFANDEVFSANGFRVDIREKDGAYQLDAELPGVSEDKINLAINNDILTVSADIESEQKNEQNGYSYCERRTGHMERSFSLDGIAQDKITASYHNGILSVTLPKEQPEPKTASRRIEISKPALQEGEGTNS